MTDSRARGMLRGPLAQDGYRPQFSGHETFPLRYGWLKKAFDAVRVKEARSDNRSVFLADDAIARFGVGRNMVAAIRHWASAAGIIQDASGEKRITTTELGRCLFGAGGLDPFMENPASTWLVHWNLSGRPAKTTWYWALNYYPATSFSREILVRGLEKLAEDRRWPRAAASTIKSDVACFIRTYVSQLPSKRTSLEDTLDAPLAELGLIRPVGKRDGFRFVRGVKPSLGLGTFCYAVADFWSGRSNARTLSFESLAHDPGSPGRVFLLEENDLVDRLSRLEELSGGLYRWSETAGLKQLIRERDLRDGEIIEFLKVDYDIGGRRDMTEPC